MSNLGGNYGREDNLEVWATLAVVVLTAIIIVAVFW